VRNPMMRKNPPINSVPYEIYVKNNEKGMFISLSHPQNFAPCQDE
jgi:hypothetical protein